MLPGIPSVLRLVAAFHGRFERATERTPSPLKQRASSSKESPFDQVHPNCWLWISAFLKHFPIARSVHVARYTITSVKANKKTFLENVSFLLFQCQ